MLDCAVETHFAAQNAPLPARPPVHTGALLSTSYSSCEEDLAVPSAYYDVIKQAPKATGSKDADAYLAERFEGEL